MTIQITIQATDDSTIWRMHISCCLTKATDTHSEYVIIIALTLQKLLRERVSVLRYTLPVLCVG
jgi:hypothetical protein